MGRPVTDSAAVAGTAFEDTIDGYFPLRESLRQMLVRNRFKEALVFILHAPAMEIPSLPPEDPVPLYITEGHGCLIRQMAIFARMQAGKAVVSGIADWNWWGDHRLGDQQFSDMHRLAEPAFIRGIGFVAAANGHDAPTQRIPNALQLTHSIPSDHIVKGTINSDGGKLELLASNSAAAKSLSIGIEPENHQQRIISDIIREI